MYGGGHALKLGGPHTKSGGVLETLTLSVVPHSLLHVSHDNA